MNDIIRFIILLFLPCMFLIIRQLYRIAVHKRILKTGIAGLGRLISCDRKTYAPLLFSAIVAKYMPIVAFDFEEKRHIADGVGFFMERPGSVGDVVEIVFSERHPNYVVIPSNKHVMRNYIRGLVAYSFLFIMMIYFWFDYSKVN